MEREAFPLKPDLYNSPPHSASLGGVGGKAWKNGEYDGVWLNPDERSSDIVPVRAWHMLKWKLDDLGLRLEFEADYRRERDHLADAYGMPLRGGSDQTAGYEREVFLFKRWHLRAWGSEPSRWPWQPIPEAA